MGTSARRRFRLPAWKVKWDCRLSGSGWLPGWMSSWVNEKHIRTWCGAPSGTGWVQRTKWDKFDDSDMKNDIERHLSRIESQYPDPRKLYTIEQPSCKKVYFNPIVDKRGGCTRGAVECVRVGSWVSRELSAEGTIKIEKGQLVSVGVIARKCDKNGSAGKLTDKEMCEERHAA